VFFFLYGSFLGVVFALPTAAGYIPCLYAGPTYSIVLTIVHFDGTSILSLHTILEALVLIEAFISNNRGCLLADAAKRSILEPTPILNIGPV
jgi:hypothetical protein